MAYLPNYLTNTDPLEWEDIPLQLALLTGEVARMRGQLTALSQTLEAAAAMVRPDLFLSSETSDDG